MNHLGGELIDHLASTNRVVPPRSTRIPGASITGASGYPSLFTIICTSNSRNSSSSSGIMTATPSDTMWCSYSIVLGKGHDRSNNCGNQADQDDLVQRFFSLCVSQIVIADIVSY